MSYGSMYSGYDMSPTGRHAGTAPLLSDLGTYGVMENGAIEWETDENYSNSILGRVRAAVDFLDTHPSLTVVVDTGATVDVPVQVVHRRLGKDGLAGRYTCRTNPDNDRLVEMRAVPR